MYVLVVEGVGLCRGFGIFVFGAKYYGIKKKQKISKMKILNILFVCIFTFLFLECHTKVRKNAEKILRKDNGKATYQYFDLDGKLEVEQEGVIDDSGRFIANGLHQEFYSSGKLKTHAYYRNGKKDSTCLFYSENGIVTRINNFYDDRRIGRQFEFYDNGKLKTIYYILNETTNLGMIAINYGILGEITSMNGRSCTALIYGQKISYRERDTLDIFNYVATGNTFKSTLEVKIFDRDDQCYFDEKYNDFSFEWYVGTPFIYLQRSFKRGNNKYMAITELRDSSTEKLVRCDTSILLVNVK